MQKKTAGRNCRKDIGVPQQIQTGKVTMETFIR